MGVDGEIGAPAAQDPVGPPGDGIQIENGQRPPGFSCDQAHRGRREAPMVTTPPMVWFWANRLSSRRDRKYPIKHRRARLGCKLGGEAGIASVSNASEAKISRSMDRGACSRMG